MSSTTLLPLVRLRAYATRRRAFLLGLAVIHLGLMLAAEWFVAEQIASGPLRAFTVGLLGIMAAAVLALPGSAAALVFIVAAGLSYLALSALESEIGVDGRTPLAYEVLGLAGALFLVHAVDALRETMPAGAAIESAVLTRWIRRVAEALVPGLLLGSVLVVLPTSARSGSSWLLGALGLLLAVGLPALTLRPRPWVTTITATDEPTDPMPD